MVDPMKGHPLSVAAAFAQERDASYAVRLMSTGQMPTSATRCAA